MQPNIVDRAAVKTIVTDMVARYLDPVNTPVIEWDLDESVDYTRNEAGGGRIILSARSSSTVGIDRQHIEPTGPDASRTVHTAVRALVLSIKIEMDVYEERDLAIDIGETIRTRSFWPAWLARWREEAGLSILGSPRMMNAKVVWDGRDMSFATVDLDCMTMIAESDDDEWAGGFFTSVEDPEMVDP